MVSCEVFDTLREAQVLIEQWRQHFNTVRPHSALGCRLPAPEVVMPGLPLPRRRPNPTGSAPPAAMLHSNSTRTTRRGTGHEERPLINGFDPGASIVVGLAAPWARAEDDL